MRRSGSTIDSSGLYELEITGITREGSPNEVILVHRDDRVDGRVGEKRETDCIGGVHCSEQGREHDEGLGEQAADVSLWKSVIDAR